jgi:hypothetical protein
VPSQQQVLDVLQESCRVLQQPSPRRGRPAQVSWGRLCMGMVLGVLQGWGAQLDLWRWVSFESWGPFAPVRVSDQAIYNRLERAEKHMRWLFEQASAWLRTLVDPWQDRRLAPFACEVLALDESTLDQVGRWLPWLRAIPSGKSELLAGRIAALFDIRRQQWVRVEIFEKAKANCKDAALQMLAGLQAGTLLLFDRGYLGFALFDALTQQGLWWISRYANHVSYQIVHICYQSDGVLDAVVSLGKYRADQARYPVRLLTFWYRGKHYRYLTNVLDPQVLPLADVARLYARRWDIELAFRLLKDFLKLNQLWSAKWPVIQLQVWACLLVAQVSHALQVQIAAQAGVEVFDVSLDLLVRLTPQWLQRGIGPQEHVVRFGRDLGLIRPSTRHQVEVPWIDPAWVIPPPASAIQPRVKVRHRPPKKPKT